ncbi:MAG: hypothetical protein JJU05_01000 [Verrucomicrobia bacterium]|nr:hypothetical protein [Verrucomicrobiota bacterium]MCH8525938.1 hypothetical protein [Kiritimatiellia bacterium]
MIQKMLMLCVVCFLFVGCAASKEDNVHNEVLNLIMRLVPEDLEEKAGEEEIDQAIRQMLEGADESLLNLRPDKAEFNKRYSRWANQFAESGLPMPVIGQELVERIENRQLRKKDFRAALLIMNYYERLVVRQLEN